MSKQTAVEWLASEINSRGPKENNPPQWLQELYEQAKEMEKQQIMDIDYRLSVIEDYAKGEAGDEITKLRSELEEYYGK
jgi:hypothetical protein